MALLLGESQAATACAGRDIGALQQGHGGRVVLGVVSTGQYFAPGSVARLLELLPQIKLQYDPRLAGGGRRGAGHYGPPAARTGGHRRPHRPRPHITIAAPDHLLVDADPALLARTAMPREEGSRTPILMTRFPDRIGEDATSCGVEMGTNETIKQAVIAGLDVALISRHTVTEELQSGPRSPCAASA